MKRYSYIQLQVYIINNIIIHSSLTHSFYSFNKIHFILFLVSCHSMYFFYLPFFYTVKTRNNLNLIIYLKNVYTNKELKEIRTFSVI